MLDAAPKSYDELPRDAAGIPIPFACGTASPSLATLDRRRVTQCALSRICGVCGAGLGRPLTLLGTPAEAARNAFHFPPSHWECAHALQAELSAVSGPALGQAAGVEWELVTTGGFEFVRPGRGDEDTWPTFQPNSRLDR